MKVPIYDIGSWDILGKHNNLKIIRLVPDIPMICVQIKLEVHQIDPVKKQGWNLGETCSYHRNQVNRMTVDPAWSHVPQREVPAPSLEADPRAGLLWCYIAGWGLGSCQRLKVLRKWSHRGSPWWVPLKSSSERRKDSGAVKPLEMRYLQRCVDRVPRIRSAAFFFFVPV